MPRPINKTAAVKIADSRLLHAMPRIVNALVKQSDADDGEVDRLQLEFYTKLLPGALERHFASDSAQPVTDATIHIAISSLAQSFSAQSVTEVDPESGSTRNTGPEMAETLDDVRVLDNRTGAEDGLTNSLSNLVTSELVSDSHGDSDQAINKDARPDVTRVSQTAALPDANSETEGRTRVRSSKGMLRRKRASIR